MKLIFYILIFILTFKNASACEIVDGNKRIPYKGESLEGLTIEKKSMSELNKQFIELNIIEKSFKGELKTCIYCKDKFITCSSNQNS